MTTSEIDLQIAAALHEAAHGFVHVVQARQFGMDPRVSLRRLVLRSDGSWIISAGNGFIDADKYRTEEMRRVQQSGAHSTVVNVMPAVLARVVEERPERSLSHDTQVSRSSGY